MKPKIEEKTLAVVSHIFLLGWVIAFVLNLGMKSKFVSFYLRQTLIPSIILFLIVSPLIGKVISLLAFVIIVMSLFACLAGDKTEFPIIGKYFQKWFKSF